MLTALGLNGSTDFAGTKLIIEQPIAAIEQPAKEVTLDVKEQK